MSIKLPNLSKANVLVVGDIMLDRYWIGDTKRMSPEAPVPIVHINESEDRAGGAANVAVNLRTLGAKVGLLGFYGQDEAAESLKKILVEKGIDLYGVEVSELPTISKLRVLSNNQQLIRIDHEEVGSSIGLEDLEREFSRVIDDYHVVVFSDYAKGALSKVSNLISIAKEKNKIILVDPKGKDFSIYGHSTLITPNAKEFEVIVGEINSEDELLDKAKALRIELDIEYLLITRSEKGMMLVGEDSTHEVRTQAKEVYDVTGAGDTVIASLAGCMAVGSSVYEAMEIANYAAGIVIGKLGTSAVSLDELRAGLHRQGVGGRYIRDVDTLQSVIRDKQAKNKKIVMTNGCFDILHAGHIRFLEEARAQGDHLIVAVNDDDSVKRLKGASRPVNNLDDRLAVLSALAAVDWVIPFSEDTPQELIAMLLPNILVKGGDYEVEEIVGAKEVFAAGGEVRVLTYHKGRSTTRIINAIRDQ